MKADRLEFYRNKLRGTPVADLGRAMWAILLDATQEAEQEARIALAAAEARESATRAILDQVMDDIRSEAFLFDGGNGISADTEDAADNLLDQPRDNSALREMIAAERERIAVHYEAQPGREFFGETIADEIRARGAA